MKKQTHYYGNKEMLGADSATGEDSFLVSQEPGPLSKYYL
jgi:hypothetical protein